MSIVENTQNSLVRQKLEERFADETDELKGLTKLILTFGSEYFTAVQGITFKIFFTQKPLNDHSAYCKKLEASVRFKLNVDFFILIDKSVFDDYSRIDKAKMIIHELHHIGKDNKGQPSIHNHNEKEDFCELPSHDLFSERIIDSLRDRLTQQAIGEGKLS